MNGAAPGKQSPATSDPPFSTELQAKPTDLPPVPEDVFCPDCGYDLRGLTGACCPECGFDLQVVRTQTPQIPWARRHAMGWFDAYWKTVWATLRTRRFCMEMVRPVSYRDSQLFRWITYAHLALPLAATPAVLTWMLADATNTVGRESVYIAVEQSVLLLVWFAALPGLASYFFHVRRWPVEQQNRGIALSYYAWGHLAWLSIVCLAIAVMGTILLAPRWEIRRFEPPMVGVAITAYIYVAVAGSLLIWFSRFQKLITRRGRIDCLWRCALLTAAAFALLGLLELLPLVVFWLRVVVASFE